MFQCIQDTLAEWGECRWNHHHQHHHHRVCFELITHKLPIWLDAPGAAAEFDWLAAVEGLELGIVQGSRLDWSV